MTAGFSVVEYVLVLALFGLLATLTFPMTVSLYEAQLLSEAKVGITTALRHAYADTVSGRHDTEHGVKLLPDSYVLFVGESYLERDVSLDHVISISESITHAGFDEVVFTATSGQPTATGTLTLTRGHTSTTITVYESGLVE